MGPPRQWEGVGFLITPRPPGGLQRRCPIENGVRATPLEDDGDRARDAARYLYGFSISSGPDMNDIPWTGRIDGLLDRRKVVLQCRRGGTDKECPCVGRDGDQEEPYAGEKIQKKTTGHHNCILYVNHRSDKRNLCGKYSLLFHTVIDTHVLYVAWLE